MEVRYTAQEKEKCFFLFHDWFCYEMCVFKSQFTINDYFIYETSMHVVIKTNFCIPLHGLLLWNEISSKPAATEVTEIRNLCFNRGLLSSHQCLTLINICWKKNDS